MRRFNAPLFFGVFALSALAGCEPLEELLQGTCGNGVVDPANKEECDGHEPDGSLCGAEGASACRYVCNVDIPGKNSKATCPERFGCGADNICRVGDGTFNLVGGTLEGDTYALSLADFDADGRHDVLVAGAEELRVHFYDPGDVLGGSLSVKGRSEMPVSKRIVPPALGQLTDGDENVDIVSHAGVSVAVLRGGGDRTLSPAQYPFTQLPPGSRLRALIMEADTSAKKPGHEVVAFVSLPGSMSTLITAVEAVDLPVGDFADFAPPSLGPVETIFGDIPTGKFIEAASCDQFALGFAGDDKVAMFSPCEPAPLDPMHEYQIKRYPVKLPAGHTVGHGVHAADMDNDGDLDLVIGAVAPCAMGPGHCCVVDVAYGDGLGGFTSLPDSMGAPDEAGALADYPEKTATSSMFYKCDPYVSGGPPPSGVPLAVGELNGDGVLDFVDYSGVVLSSIDVNQALSYSHAFGSEIIFDNGATNPWTHALIGDVNFDNIPDVVAGSSFAPGLDVSYGSLIPGLFNRQSITTSRPTSHLTAGFFDGDLAQDVVFAESVDPNSDEVTESTMSVLFGNILQPLGVPVKLADTGRIEQIVSGLLFSQVLGSVDTMTEIAAITTDSSDTTSALVFPGSIYRQLVSPYRILLGNGEPKTTDLFIPLALTVGRFGEGQLPEDVAAIAASFTTKDENGQEKDEPTLKEAGIVVMTSTGDASLPALMPASSLIQSDALSNALQREGLLNPVITAINLETEEEPSGLDELVLFVPQKSGEGAPPYLAWFVAKSEGAAWKVEDKGTLAPSFLLSQKPLKTIVADIDANNHDDLAILYFDDNHDAHIDVIWNDGPGTFGAIVSRVVSEPFMVKVQVEGQGEDERVVAPEDFVLVNLDDDRELEIVVASATGIYTADVARDASALMSSKLAKTSGYAGKSSFIEAGDITGDGVVDLAVGTTLGVQVLEGNPAVR